MHKRIVDAIKLALGQDERNKIKFEVVKPSVKGGVGFYKLKVSVGMGQCHLIPLIERVGIHIGYFYGEGLHVDKMKHVVIFS